MAHFEIYSFRLNGLGPTKQAVTYLPWPPTGFHRADFPQWGNAFHLNGQPCEYKRDLMHFSWVFNESHMASAEPNGLRLIFVRLSAAVGPTE